jgi:hypothetical protein
MLEQEQQQRAMDDRDNGRQATQHSSQRATGKDRSENMAPYVAAFKAPSVTSLTLIPSPRLARPQSDHAEPQR